MFGQSNTGGFGGFGNNNQQQQQQPAANAFGGGGGGGGFGQSATPAANTGFGSTGGAFGQTTGAFGAAQPAQTGFGAAAGGGTGFGSSTPAFGAAKSAFGSSNTGGGGLFGASNNPATSTGGGGFGFGANTASAAPAFGAAATTGGGLFGAKPAFGAPATTSAPGTGGGLFGAGATTGAFGNPATTGTAGIGFNNTQLPMNGTNTVPFQPYTEKEGNTTITNHFQTISLMPAYKNFSLEELRLQDYNQGRRYGGAAQGGAFGTNTGFGAGATNTASTGFGSTPAASGGGLFGNANNTQQTNAFGGGGAGFGAAPAASTGGLFGAAKPAATGGGLFGAAQPASTGGGLFGGAATATSGGFGSNTGAFGAAQPAAGGGLFGNTQNKPLGFGTTAAPATGAFGAAPTATTGFGGAAPGGGLFGNNNQQQQQQQPATGFGAQPATGTGFGSNTGAFGGAAQPAQTSAFGGGGAFGSTAQQNKPAFGAGFGTAPAAATGGGLFGNNQQQAQQQPQQTGGLFGGAKPAFGAAPAPATGGLFGSQPPAQPQQTGGLFGNPTPAATNTGGGLFGGQQNPPAQPTGGLFGKPTGTGLFGAPTTTPTQTQGGGLFGGSMNSGQQQQQQQPMGTSLFGGNQQQPNNLGQSSMGNSMFGQSQQQQQFTTSISDSPYGNSKLAGLGSSMSGGSPLGPIATPIAGQTKKAAAIPHHKIAPRQPSLTPRLGGSFSRSASPFGPSSTGGQTAHNGSLNRSFNAGNKLNLFDNDDSVLSAGAFTPGGSSRMNSLKKLVIDKKIRDHDLFAGSQEPRPRAIENGSARSSTKSILKKTVSFDMAGDDSREQSPYGTNGSPIRQSHGATPTTEELGYIRGTPERRRNRDEDLTPQSAQSSHTESDSSSVGKELALVNKPEDDKSQGTYWMVPSASKLKSYPKEQLKKFIGLTVGRRGYGSVRFENPVDLTNMEVELEDIPGNVVTFDQRVCTVYPEGLTKPPPGKGLNVPATITLEDCFPVTKNERGKIRDPEHPRYITHIRRLKGIKDTEFVDYIAKEGIWIFRVAHFTTYGLVDSDDEEDDADMTYDQTNDSILGQTPTPRREYETSSIVSEDDFDTMDADISGVSGLDDSTFGANDTFEYKKTGPHSIARRQPTHDPVPGSFLGSDGEEDAPYSDEDEILDGDITLDGQPFLDDGSAGSASEEEPAEPLTEDEYTEEELTDIAEEEEDSTAIMDEDTQDGDADDDTVTFDSPDPWTARAGGETPKALPLGKDWTEQLNNTISPVKRRFGGQGFFPGTPGTAVSSPVKRSTIEPINYGLLDLHNDLYGSQESNTARLEKTRKRDLVESPPTTEPKRSEGVRAIAKQPAATTIPQTREKFNYDDQDEAEKAWRKAVRPAWAPDGSLIYAGELEGSKATHRKSGHSLRISKVNYGLRNDVPGPLDLQLRATQITIQKGVPFAQLDPDVHLAAFAAEVPYHEDPASQHERHTWKLASVLWDPLEDLPKFDYSSSDLESYVEEKRRKELLGKFLEELVEHDANYQAKTVSTAEEAAFAHLTAHRIEQACAILLEVGNFRLATLIPQLGGDQEIRDKIKSQIHQWRSRGILAEISAPVRALYELVAGETCFSEGVKGPLEDAAPSFFLADVFHLDWRRNLALKLWYGTKEDEGISAAVSAYEADIAAHPEKPFVPTAYYSRTAEHTDTLWNLLKLYSEPSLELSSALTPRTFSENPLSLRLPWQLHTILSCLDIRSSPELTKLTTDFATTLATTDNWEYAIFILLHLPSPTQRQSAIRAIIAQNIHHLTPDKHHFLTITLQIPPTWLHEARALFARSIAKHIEETEHLIRAGSWAEAHKTLVTHVAPEAVISADHEPLKRILAMFTDRANIDGWAVGGQVFADYVQLVEGRGDKGVVLERLMRSLPQMAKRGFLQGVAVELVGKEVAKCARKQEKSGGVLELPLGGGERVREVVKCGLEGWKARLGVVG